MQLEPLYPWALWALLGGAFIAISCTLNLYLSGRITGMSSIFYTLINWDTKEGLTWKYIFLVGMVTPVYILYLLDAKINDVLMFDTSCRNIWGFIVGGLIVGLGTKIGNGCTSGHAVCGIARLSKRSIVATCIFLACGLGIGTLFTSQKWLRDPSDWNDFRVNTFKYISYALIGLLFAGGVYVAITEYKKKSENKTLIDMAISFALGAFFGVGLAVSGMCNPSKIVAFLSINDNWDLSLIFVMMSAVGINLVTFQLILRNYEAPVFSGKFPSVKSEFDLPVIVGPILFGIGWGIAGLCPGPGMLGLFLLPQGFLFVAALAIGQVLASKVVLPLMTPRTTGTATEKMALAK